MNELGRSIVSRPVWGAIHMKFTKLFTRDQAHYRAPCSMPGCNVPHERKCDFVIGVYLQNGVRMTQVCNRVMCKGCAQTYSQVDNMNTLDYCPEHDKILLEGIHNSKR